MSDSQGREAKATIAKEVGVKKPAEETIRRPKRGKDVSGRPPYPSLWLGSSQQG